MPSKSIQICLNDCITKNAKSSLSGFLFILNIISISFFDCRILENLIMWTILREKIQHLPLKYKEAKFEFDKVYKGTASTVPRVIYCSSYVLEVMEYAVGRLYVSKHFDEKSKRSVSFHFSLRRLLLFFNCYNLLNQKNILKGNRNGRSNNNAVQASAQKH